MIFPLIGNENVKGAVENAISARRIPHAILIEGDAGLGRHTLAHFIANAAVCAAEVRPCGECKGCKMFGAMSHPDVLTIAPEDNKKNITVAQIRTLRADAYIKPHSADFKVFIIDGAERMNEQAQNALLKVLEEPPANVIFILVSLSRTILLETIVSRCTVLSLSAPEQSAAIEHLKSATDYDADKISAAVKQSGGNIGAALNLLCGKADSLAVATAKQFVKLLFTGSAADLLVLLHPLEKNRVATADFFSELRLCILSEMRASANNAVKCRALDTLYESTRRYSELLNTNINLPLLFCALVCNSKQLVER